MRLFYLIIRTKILASRLF